MAQTTTDTPSSEDEAPPCVLVFNANDPCGAGGLTGDVLAVACAGAHPLTVLTGSYIRDSAETMSYDALDEDSVSEQARVILEDVAVQALKVGFVGSPENLSAVASVASDYPELPVIAYMPNLSWWDEVHIDLYQDAFQELVLPQTTVLVGNHSTLWRWLLPDWESERNPSARDLARAAADYGVPYLLVTGIPEPDQFINNALSTPETVLAQQHFERFDAVFAGAGDTLSATLSALIAAGTELTAAFEESLAFLDQTLQNGFRPGMGRIIPDRLFWAQAEEEDTDNDDSGDSGPGASMELPPHDTKH